MYAYVLGLCFLLVVGLRVDDENQLGLGNELKFMLENDREGRCNARALGRCINKLGPRVYSPLVQPKTFGPPENRKSACKPMYVEAATNDATQPDLYEQAMDCITRTNCLNRVQTLCNRSVSSTAMWSPWVSICYPPDLCELKAENKSTSWLGYALSLAKNGAVYGPELELVHLQDKLVKEKGAVCLDGSPGAYYIRKSRTKSNKWLIHLQGGGWCRQLTSQEFDVATCTARSMFNLGTTKYDKPTFATSGVLSGSKRYNPEFWDFNTVFIRYCDGGSYTGDRNDPVNVTNSFGQNQTLYFRGKRIVDAVFEQLNATTDFSKAESTLLTGQSAGGLGVYLHANYIGKHLLPKSVKVYKVMPMVGFFLLHDAVDGNNYYERDLKNVYEMQNSNLQALVPACVAMHQDTPWKCIFAQNVYPTLLPPVFVIQSVSDQWQMQQILTGKGTPFHGNSFPSWTNCTETLETCTSSQVNTLLEYRQSMLQALTTATTFQKKGNGAFISSCLDNSHGMASFPYSLRATDHTLLSTAMSKWWKSAPSTPARRNTYLPCEIQPGVPHTCNQNCNAFYTAPPNWTIRYNYSFYH